MSDSSELSSPPSSDDELQKLTAKTLSLKKGKLIGATSRKKNEPVSSPDSSPPRQTRELSPPHEYVLADNPDIATLVMFRSRFSEAFPKHVPNLGPQDIENGVSGSEPSEQVENFLCALLGLVLNRKKYVERGHHGRALEEAIQTQKHQWPTAWGTENPLHGNRNFTTMDATERLTLLKSLVDWCLSSSEVIATLIKDSYKQARHEDDLNQPRSVQPWGLDGRKRRYWLIEGQSDTSFRLYRESPAKLVNKTWWSIAGTIDELRAVGEELKLEGSQAARRLADRISQSIPRLEQSDDKRKRREYRQSRKAAFSRPEPGFSMYEGRTRGKKMRYTYSDEEDEDAESDAPSVRRSARHSDGSTPTDPTGPMITASGRQVRSKYARGVQNMTESTSDMIEGNMSETSTNLHRNAETRTRRSGRTNGVSSRRNEEYNSIDELDDEDEAASSGGGWSGDDDDVVGKLDHDMDDEDDDMSDSSSGNSLGEMKLDQHPSLVVRLKYRNADETGTERSGVANDTNHSTQQTNDKDRDEGLASVSHTEDKPGPIMVNHSSQISESSNQEQLDQITAQKSPQVPYSVPFLSNDMGQPMEQDQEDRKPYGQSSAGISAETASSNSQTARGPAMPSVAPPSTTTATSTYSPA